MPFQGLCVSFFFICLQLSLLAGSWQWGRAVDELFARKHALLIQPQMTVRKFCREESLRKNQTALNWRCLSTLQWKNAQRRDWFNVCDEPFSSQNFPQRYYRLQLRCELAWPGVEPLRVEEVSWVVFR